MGEFLFFGDFFLSWGKKMKSPIQVICIFYNVHNKKFMECLSAGIDVQWRG